MTAAIAISAFTVVMADPTLAGSGKAAGTKLVGHVLLLEPYPMIPVTGPDCKNLFSSFPEACPCTVKPTYASYKSQQALVFPSNLSVLCAALGNYLCFVANNF